MALGRETFKIYVREVGIDGFGERQSFKEVDEWHLAAGVAESGDEWLEEASGGQVVKVHAQVHYWNSLGLHPHHEPAGGKRKFERVEWVCG